MKIIIRGKRGEAKGIVGRVVRDALVASGVDPGRIELVAELPSNDAPKAGYHLTGHTVKIEVDNESEDQFEWGDTVEVVLNNDYKQFQGRVPIRGVVRAKCLSDHFTYCVEVEGTLLMLSKRDTIRMVE